MADDAARGGFKRAFSNRNLRIYWAGNAFSVVGFWLHRMALGWLTWELTESTIWLGTIGFWSLFPSVILSPLAGAAGDRWGLRRVPAISLIIMGGFGVGLAILTLTDQVTIEWLLTLTILQGVVVSFDLANRQALVPSLVGRDDLPAAIAVNSKTFHAGGFVGPAIFGITFPFIGVGGAFVISSVSYFFFAALLLMIRLEQEVALRNRAAGLFGDIKEGFKYVAGEPGVMVVFTVSAIGHLLIRPYIDMLPAFSAEIFDRGAEGLATMQAVTGLGALFAGILLAWHSQRRGLTRWMAAASFATTTCIFLFSLTDRYEVGLAILFVLGFALLSGAVCSQALVQA